MEDLSCTELGNNFFFLKGKKRMLDPVTIDRLDAEANLQSLDQCKIVQIQGLLYDCSTNIDYIRNY